VCGGIAEWDEAVGRSDSGYDSVISGIGEFGDHSLGDAAGSSCFIYDQDAAGQLGLDPELLGWQRGEPAQVETRTPTPSAASRRATRSDKCGDGQVVDGAGFAAGGFVDLVDGVVGGGLVPIRTCYF
jgi:hypothetical protein